MTALLSRTRVFRATAGVVAFVALLAIGFLSTAGEVTQARELRILPNLPDGCEFRDNTSKRDTLVEPNAIIRLSCRWYGKVEGKVLDAFMVAPYDTEWKLKSLSTQKESNSLGLQVKVPADNYSIDITFKAPGDGPWYGFQALKVYHAIPEGKDLNVTLVSESSGCLDARVIMEEAEDECDKASEKLSSKDKELAQKDLGSAETYYSRNLCPNAKDIANRANELCKVTDDGGIPPWVWVIVAIGAVVVVSVLAYALLKRPPGTDRRGGRPRRVGSFG